MKLKELLEQKGFKHNVDFQVEGHNIIILPQKRVVPAVPGAPAQYDKDGNEVSPAIEPIPEHEETFYAEIGNATEYIRECLLRHPDLGALLNEYLEVTPHMKHQNDSANIELLVRGELSGWRFMHCPAPSIEQLYDLMTPAAEREQKRKDDEEKKLTKKQKAKAALKAVDLGKVTTVAALKGVMKEVIDLLDD